MRPLFAILAAMLLASTLRAADRVTLTVTITNQPAAAETFVLNADTRTWIGTVVSPTTQIATNATIGGSATNLYTHLLSYPFSGPVNISFSSTNQIILRGQVGQAMAASIGAATYATLSYSTQTVAQLRAVRVPVTSEPTQSTATNMMSDLASGLSSHSTNSLSAGTTLVANLVQTTGAQTVAGDKTFSDDVTVSGTATLADADLASGSLTNVVLGSITLNTEGQGVEFNAFTRLGIDADGFPALYEISGAGAVNGAAASFPLKDESVFNTLQGDQRFPGKARTNAFTSVSINRFSGLTAFPATTTTSLANGNNAAVSPGTGSFLRVGIGPTGAFAICGISGGEDGRMIIVYNVTGQAMTIANDSGVDPTAANRIYTNTGSDYATTGNGSATLIYDATASRWIVISTQD